VKFGAAVFGYHVDLRSAFEAILGGVGVRLDIDLGDRVDAGDAAEISAAAAVTAIHAVRVNRVAAPALERRDRRLVAASPGILVRDDLNARQGLEYRHRVAAFNRDQIHLLAV